MSGPFVDVADILLDPDFADSFDVVRRPEVVTAQGISTVPNPVTFKRQLGTVTNAGPKDLQRLEDMDYTRRVMSVVTQFMLRATSPGYKPDQVIWRGDTYEVVDLAPYPSMGPGWVQALVASIDRQDQPPAPNPPPI